MLFADAAADRGPRQSRLHGAHLGRLAADFSIRVWNYYELRSRLQEGLPPLEVTENPAEFSGHERLWQARIRVARDGAKEGDLFTRPISVQFKQVLLLETTALTWAVIMDDNPGEFSHRINGAYPKRPLSTMPYTILTRLPTLPPDIEYRFVGRHLILHDTRANLILAPNPLRHSVYGLQ